MCMKCQFSIFTLAGKIGWIRLEIIIPQILFQSLSIVCDLFTSIMSPSRPPETSVGSLRPQCLKFQDCDWCGSFCPQCAKLSALPVYKPSPRSETNLCIISYTTPSLLSPFFFFLEFLFVKYWTFFVNPVILLYFPSFIVAVYLLYFLEHFLNIIF